MDPQREISAARPLIAVLETPSEVDGGEELPLKWATHFRPVGEKQGDVIARSWNISIRGGERV